MEAVALPLAIGLAVAALAVASWSAVLLSRMLRRERTERAGLAARVDLQQQEIRSEAASMLALAERIGHTERRFEQLVRRLEEMKLRQEQIDRNAEPQVNNYAQAVKLAQKGASPEELMELCNLTRGEAELVAMMHRMGNGRCGPS